MNKLKGLYNVFWNNGKIAEGWRVFCIVPVYKGKENRSQWQAIKSMTCAEGYLGDK